MNSELVHWIGPGIPDAVYKHRSRDRLWRLYFALEDIPLVRRRRAAFTNGPTIDEYAAWFVLMLAHPQGSAVDPIDMAMDRPQIDRVH
jgi:hypothetical protein